MMLLIISHEVLWVPANSTWYELPVLPYCRYQLRVCMVPSTVGMHDDRIVYLSPQGTLQVELQRVHWQDTKCSFPFPNGTIAPVTCFSLLNTRSFGMPRIVSATSGLGCQATPGSRQKQETATTGDVDSRILSYNSRLFVVLDHHCCCCCCCRLHVLCTRYSYIPEVRMQPSWETKDGDLKMINVV